MDVRLQQTVDHPMPEMAAFVAGLRAAFGDAVIDDAVRRGKSGEATFYACENGRSVGTASPTANSVWQVDGTLRDRHFCAGCDGSCVGQDVRCSRTVKLDCNAGK